MKTAFVKKLIVFVSFIFIIASCFAQTTPWYIGAFSAADGSKLLITESRIYSWPAHRKGFIVCDYSSDDVDWSSDGGMIIAWVDQGSPFGDGGQIQLELTADKTIVDFETVYKKNPALLTSLKNEAKKLDQEEELAAQAYKESYTEFVEANKWLQGMWKMPSPYGSGQSYLFIFPQGLFYIDPSIGDGKVWQLETKAERENSDSSRRPVTKNDTRGTIYLGGGTFPVDMSSRTVTFCVTGAKLLKCRL